MQTTLTNIFTSVALGIVILATIAFSAGPTEAQTSGTRVLPLSKVADYMKSHYDNTSIKNGQIEKDLVGRVYTATVKVDDVIGDDDGKSVRIVAIMSPPSSSYACRFYFKTKDPQMVKKASELSKRTEVSLTAKL